MQKTLIIIGLLMILIGLALPVVHKIPLGRLPGDIFISRPGFKAYFPLTSMLVVSLVISLILWLLKK